MLLRFAMTKAPDRTLVMTMDDRRSTILLLSIGNRPSIMNDAAAHTD